MTSPKVNIKARVSLIKSLSCFDFLSDEISEAFALLWQEINVSQGFEIVKEETLVDSVFIIVKGEAEVSRQEGNHKNKKAVPLALLREGETIGLQESGFYSTSGKRTATVTALTQMLLLKLDVAHLEKFLQTHQLASDMQTYSQQMLRMRFIKQCLPFSKLSHERLQWLSKHVEENHFQSGDMLFKQGDLGDKSYLICSGEVELLIQDEEGERTLSLLKPPVLFGETTLITQSPRNASAVARTACHVLTLSHAYLSELLAQEKNVSYMFMTLMVERSRPQKKPEISSHERRTADGAAALTLMLQSHAEKLGLKPLAKIIAHASSAKNPQEFTTAPIDATKTLLQKLNWQVSDVDLFEVNEAFAVVALAFMRALNIPREKVNIHGGACALGHPIGATGARIIVTLIAALKENNLKRGIATLCIGGGEATAIAIEMM